MPKLSVSRGRRCRFTRSATRAASIAGSTSSGCTGLTVISSERREPEQPLERTERDQDELVLRVAEDRPLLLADAEHDEVHPVDLDGPVNRVAALEQLVGGLQPSTATLRARSTSIRVGIRPVSAA
jgi:hypothetical protein